MIYIFTALYYEAHIFIRQFKLIKNQENTWFQEFYNETSGIRLIITGVGEITAAAAVGSTCSLYKPTSEDLLLNVGICAHTEKNEGIFLCNKIIEKATDKTFYPDMIYRHNFSESAIVTGMQPWVGENSSSGMSTSDSAGYLHDMEAASVYQAGIRFFGPHQMIFLKIVSDSGYVKTVAKQQVIHLMDKHQDDIFDYFRQLSAVTQNNRTLKGCLCQKEIRILETFCTDLHCSKAMRDSMRQCVHYLTLAGIDYVYVIQEMYEKGLLPCKDKREGKLYFEEFKRRLL